MADQDTPPPPKPKPGSLRDRIAAFEHKPSTTAGTPPAPRPKPGNVQWKPKPTPASPPASPSASATVDSTSNTPERKVGGLVGMSAADAKESIGKGGSLKERMAALQGRGGFGGAPPPMAPKPAVDKPKWKPPPVVSPPAQEEQEEPMAEGGALESAPALVKSPREEPTELPLKDVKEEKEDAGQQEPDAEEEERQRRAAIAARMARLGGARLGMAPPVFAKKPEPKKAETPKPNSPRVEEEKGLQELPTKIDSSDAGASPPSRRGSVQSKKAEAIEHHESISPPVQISDPSDTTRAQMEQPSNSSQSSLLQSDSASIISPPGRSPPTSMPVPAGPRRAGPPRKKPAVKSTSATSTDVLEDGAQVKESPVTTPAVDVAEAATIPLATPHDSESHSVDQEKVHGDISQEKAIVEEDVEPVPQATSEPEVPALSSEPPRPSMQEDAKDGTAPHTSDHALQPDAIDQPIPEAVSEAHITEADQPTAITPVSSSTATAEPVTEDEVVEHVEDEVDDATRRKRIAERLAKTGGLNPFAAPPPLGARRPPSASTSPTSPDTVASPRSPAISTARSSMRKSSTDSAAPQTPASVVASASSPSSPVTERRSSMRKGSTESSVEYEGKSPVSPPVSASPPISRSPVSPTSSRRKSSVAVEREIVQEEQSEDDRTITAEEPLAVTPVAEDFEDNVAQHDQINDLEDEEEGVANAHTRDGHEAMGEISVKTQTHSDDDLLLRHDNDDLKATDSNLANVHSSHQIELAEEEYEEPASEQESDFPTRGDEALTDEEDEMAPPRIKRSLPSVPQYTPTAPPGIDDGADSKHSPAQQSPARRPSRDVPLSPQPEHFAPPPPIDPTASVARPSRRSMPPPPPPPPAPVEPEELTEDYNSEAADELDEAKEQSVEQPDGERISQEQQPTEGEFGEEDNKPQIYSPSQAKNTGFPVISRNEERQGLIPPSRPTPPIVQDERSTVITPLSSFPQPPTRRSMPPPPRAAPVAPQIQDTKPFHTMLGEGFTDAPTEDNDSPANARSEVPSDERIEREILDDSDGDPIDPVFHSLPSRSPERSPPKTSTLSPTETQSRGHPPVSDPVVPGDDGDNDQLRRRTIAERMAKLGGIKFGAAPPVPRSQRPAPAPEAAEAEQDSEGAPAETEEMPLSPQNDGDEDEDEERARKARISAKLAGMGGMRFGMLPPVPQNAPSPHPRMQSDDSNTSGRTVSPPPPPRRPAAPPPPPPAPEPESEFGTEQQILSDSELVNVEEDESEMEELSYHDAKEEAPPPVPSRSARPSRIPQPEAPPPVPPGRRTGSPTARPPIPNIGSMLGVRQDSAGSPIGSDRKVSNESAPSFSHIPPPPPLHGDFVMVDEPDTQEFEVPPPPPPRHSRGPPPRSAPAPPPPPPEKGESGASQTQWGLPDIPSGSFELTQGGDLSSSAWSEDSTTYPTEHSPSQSLPRKPTARPEDVQLSADDLLALWGRVGVHVGEIANTLYEKSKRALIGDGTYPGFLTAVLSQVPGAALPSPSLQSYGHLIYSQAGNTVQKRASDIMPGDVITLADAKLKGHKGLQTYHQSVGAGGDPVVGVVSEFEPKKSKVKAYQANQHVGGQTVELVSYRLEDLKSGNVKVFRVAEA